MAVAKRGVWRRGWETLLATIRLYGEIDGEQRAASFAYYVIFSLIPLIVLLLTIGSTFFSPQEITDTIKGFLPINPDQQEFIWKSVHRLELQRGGVSIISVIILLWCSLRFFQALVRGVNRAWHTVEIPWWQIPLKNLLMIFIIGSALFAGILIPALLQGVRNALLSTETFMKVHFPNFDLHLISGILDLSRYAMGAVVLFYSFSMLYMLAPRRRAPFIHVWLPALAVTLALQLCQIAFVAVLPRFITYGIYGTFAGMLFMLLWVYFSGIIIIFGGCLSAILGKQALPPKKN